MFQPEKQRRIKSSGKLINAIKIAIKKNRIRRKEKKTAGKISRREKMYLLKTKVDDFMKAAFEPKSITTARRKKKKSERNIQKGIKDEQ